MPPAYPPDLRTLGAATTCAVLAGCLVIPIDPFVGEPYPQALLAKLSSPTSGRSEVRAALGAPLTTRLGDTYWFYAREIPVAAILGDKGSTLITRMEWVAVEFDGSGHVSFLGHMSGRDGCLANGICNYSNELLAKEPASAAITAPEIHDAEARAFTPRDECAVYFYWEPAGVKRMSGPVTLSVDGREHGATEYRSYLFFTHPPGTLHLGALKIGADIECRAGEKVYVKGMNSWEKPWGAAVLRMSDAEGEAAIRGRRMALPR